MEDKDQSQNEPQDTVNEQISNNTHNTAEQISTEITQKLIEEENNKIKSEENGGLIQENNLVKEALDQKSLSIINLANELEYVLASIKTTWENDLEGFNKYYTEGIKPKLNEYLSYPCITANQEKVILIFSFICKYFLNRMNFLKILPKEEMFMMLSIIYNNHNIFSLHPNVGGNQEYELIVDKYFYQVFKEILPNKEVENSYGLNDKNCCYKYFMEFIFQSKFVDCYICDFLFRIDISPIEFGNLCYFPANLLYLCDKDFIKKNKWNTMLIKTINTRIEYFLSEGNPLYKDENVMSLAAYSISTFYFPGALGIFSHLSEDMKFYDANECKTFATIVFRFNEHLLKNPKINIRMSGMQYIGFLCNEYLKFGNMTALYYDFLKKHDDAEKIYNFLIEQGIEYLTKMKIFDYIFGENIHEGLIQRSYPIVSLMYKNKVFDSFHIQILWNLSQTKYQSISNAIISLFGDLLPEFSIEDCNSILKIVDKMPLKEVNDITLKLLENFFKGNMRLELLLNILFKFSNELSCEKGLDQNIIFKSRSILMRLLMNKYYHEDLLKYIKRSIFHIHKFYLFDTYFSTLSQILEYLANSANQAIYTNFKFEIEIKNFETLISYLDDKYKLFPILMNYLIKIIQLFEFFYTVSIKILEQLNNGNFDYDNLFNIDFLYSEYISYRESNLNFKYNLGRNNIENNNKNGMDIEFNNKISNNSINEDFCLESEFKDEIKDQDQENYIKNLIKTYAKFFSESLKSSNTLPSFNELKNCIFCKLKIDFKNYSYGQIIAEVIKSIFWNHLRGKTNFKLDYLNFLFNIAQSTKDIDPSLTWYYNLLNDIFKARIDSNNVNLIDEATMNTIINTQIKNSNYETMPISAYNTVLTFVIYINLKISNAVYSTIIQKFTEIKSFKNFFGFYIFWSFYIYTKNDQVLNAALNTIINILELISKKEEDRNHMINMIFDFIAQNKNKIKDNPQTKISIIRSLKVIAVILGKKINKDVFENNANSNGGKNMIKVLVKNHYFDFQDQENYYININNEQTIKNVKEFIINNILCSVSNLAIYNMQIKDRNEIIIENNNNININDKSEEEKMNIDIPSNSPLNMEQFKKMVYNTNIIINYKNTVLKDEFSVADYHIEDNTTLLIFKGGGNQENEYVPSESVLQEGYTAIRLIFGDSLYFGEDVMKAAIIKYKGNSEEAGLYLTIPENVQILQKEIEEKKSQIEQKHDEIIYLEEEKINLLIDVLSNNSDQDIVNQIWELFSSIKYPDNMIKAIIGESMDNIFNIKDMNKMILYFEILDSLIFGGEFCKYNKVNVNQKKAWISNFIKNEALIKKIFFVLNQLNTDISSFNLYKILKIFISWFHIILLKICEFVGKVNENAANIIPEINMFRSLNSQVNIQNNNTNNKENHDENEKDKKDEFKIINDQTDLNILNTINEIQGDLIFYKLMHLVIQLNMLEQKKILLEQISEFILMSLMLQKSNIQNFCKIEKNKGVLVWVVINSQLDFEREIIKNFMKILIRNLLPLTDTKDLQTENNIFNVLFQSFINQLLSGVYFNREFSDIFSYLLVYTTNNIVLKAIEPLIYKFLENIYNFGFNIEKCNEIQLHVLKTDANIINSCLKFYHKIITNYINILYEKKKIDYIEFLFDFLFLIQKNKNSQKINSYKFKDNLLRNNLFNLLTELISLDNKYLLRILPKLILHHKKLEISDPNAIETPLDVNIRAPEENLIGLRNFGSTCYLNSLTQQLFMMPSFRKDLFNNFIMLKKPDDINEKESTRYSVIYNLQLTFENLKHGSMSPYPPKRFIKSFVSAFNGEPIQFGIQQDSDEFLSILCENLEKEAKTFNKENFLENSFKGKISNEILSLEKEYPYYSQSEEPFFRITLDIKGHKSLEEALDAYVKGEILDGDNKYYVEEHKRKISIRKSSSLKMLGNIVIIHLKRFEFDFITFNNYKLSDYLKFPTKINFKKWTRAFLRLNDNPNNKLSEDLLKITDLEKLNLIDDNMDYILTGILVHGGSNIQSGHYYSYIMDQETGRWHQFNDNIISDYDINNELEKECFGNLGGNNINQYGKTAYLLFYTKKSIFRNKNLWENININNLVLNDVYNENLKFLNMNIYLNDNYFNFIKKICTCGIPLLNDEIQNNRENNLTLNNKLLRDGYIYKKVLSVLKPDDSDNDSVDENIINDEDNEENNITKMKNFEQVYNKCKEEIDSIIKEEKEERKKLNNFINKRKLIKLYFNYVFGVILPHFQNPSPLNQNKQLLSDTIKTLIDIIKENKSYSLWILKQIEKNIPLFTDILFRFGTTENELSDIAKLFLELFQITFEVIYHYEKENMEISNDVIKYFVKNSEGKFIIIKEFRSIVMRLIKKLFCDNLEKSRIEYSRSSLYLITFYNFVRSYPETASITVNYFFPLVSLISNNILETIKSESNPNYLMGNNKGYQVNYNYILIFCDTILRCVTPGMKNTNTFSPYFSNRKQRASDSSFINWSQYPCLPKNWEKILSIEFYVNFMLFHNYAKSKEIICHLCYCDEENSVKILKLVNAFTKTKSFFPFIEKVFNNALYVFDLRDNLELIRADALFELEDKNYLNTIELERNKNLFEHLEEEKDNSMKFVLTMLYSIGKAIEKYDDILGKYFENNKSKLKWIGMFIFMIKNDQITKEKYMKDSGYILNQHPDLLQIIQEQIIKRFDLK